MVTSGATEAIAGALFALIEPGDEVVLFEPMYDAYLPLVRRAGGVPRFVTLAPPAFRLTEEALARAFSPRTKVALFNNPLNPTATIFSDADLALLAEFCIRHDAIALCDEVWEHVVFDGRRHKPLIALPGMRERTVKIGSAGKIFNLTGWKVGFVCAAAPIMRVLAKAHQFITFTTPPNLQAAVAYGLGQGRRLFRGHARRLRQQPRPLHGGPRRARLRRSSRRRRPTSSTSTSPLGEPDDTAFCRRLVLDHGVAAIPVSAFYAEGPCGPSCASASPSATRRWIRRWSGSRGWCGGRLRPPRRHFPRRVDRGSCR